MGAVALTACIMLSVILVLILVYMVGLLFTAGVLRAWRVNVINRKKEASNGERQKRA
jgi:hypothetical protein